MLQFEFLSVQFQFLLSNVFLNAMLLLLKGNYKRLYSIAAINSKDVRFTGEVKQVIQVIYAIFQYMLRLFYLVLNK